MSLFVETRPYHAGVDEVLRSLITGDVDIDDYTDTLIRIYGFEAPLEAALAYTPGFHAVFDIERRSGLIVRDLLALGLRPSQLTALPQCGIAPFPNPAVAMGWLYMHERFRLQHPVAYHRLIERLPQTHLASGYFCRDEIALGSRWGEFAAALEQIARDPKDRRLVLDAAKDAYRRAEDWYRGDALHTPIPGWTISPRREPHT